MESGVGSKMKKSVTAFDLAVLLFATMGTIEYETMRKGDLGYAWMSSLQNDKVYEAMVNAEVIKDVQEKYGLPNTSWLEYSLRRASAQLIDATRLLPFGMQGGISHPTTIRKTKTIWKVKTIRKMTEDDEWQN
jgi:hypothetical protein